MCQAEVEPSVREDTADRQAKWDLAPFPPYSVSLQLFFLCALWDPLFFKQLNGKDGVVTQEVPLGP